MHGLNHHNAWPKLMSALDESVTVLNAGKNAVSGPVE